MSDRMTLSDVLRRDVPIEWYEAVALVRGVTACLLETQTEALFTPELHEIDISGSGSVDVTGRTKAGEPVRHLGQILQATLGRAEAPVRLGQLIMQATASSPAFASIREFDDALAYFERPGRDVLIQALYARAAQSPVSSFAWPPMLDAIAPLPTTEPEAAKRRAGAKSTPPVMKIAAVILPLVVTTATWYASGARVTAAKRDVSGIARQASDAVGAAVRSGLSAVTGRTGLGRVVPAGARAGESVAAAEGDKQSAKRPGVKRSVPAPNTSVPPAEAAVILDLDASNDSDIAARF